jgi:hypothetical protein
MASGTEGVVSNIPCSWCGNPAVRRYPGRLTRGVIPDRIIGAHPAIRAHLAPDCYLCPDCDALVQAGKPLPAGVATFSVAVREDG